MNIHKKDHRRLKRIEFLPHEKSLLEPKRRDRQYENKILEIVQQSWVSALNCR